MLGIPKVKHYGNVKQTSLTIILQSPTGPRFDSLFDKLSKITPHKWLHKIVSGLSKTKWKIYLTQMPHIKTSQVTFIRPSSLLLPLLRLHGRQLRLYQSAVLKLALELPLYLCRSLYTLGWMGINTKVNSSVSDFTTECLENFCWICWRRGKKKGAQNTKIWKKTFFSGYRAVLTLCGMPQINGYRETLE